MNASIIILYTYYLQAYIYGSYRSAQSLVIVKHDSAYNLYLSDQTGIYYTLSLEDLVGQNFRVDLRIVRNNLS